MLLKRMQPLLIYVIALLAPLSAFGQIVSEASAIFTFIYDGPNEIAVDSNCIGLLDWGAPDNPRVIYNGPPGGFLVSFSLRSISDGYEVGDSVPAGETVRVRYRAADNQGNIQNFIFTIDFVDQSAPIFIPSTLPADTSISCIAELPPLQVRARDNCTDSAQLIIRSSLSDSSISECTGGQIERTIQAIDESGNIATHIQRILIEADTIGPTIVQGPQPDSTFCEQADLAFTSWVEEQLQGIEAFDESCNDYHIYLDSSRLPEDLNVCGSFPVYFTIEDQCGNSTEIQTSYTIIDTLAPRILAEARSDSADCSMPGVTQSFSDWLALRGGMRVEDNCRIQWRTMPDSITLSDACNTTLDLTFIAEDACMRSVQSSASYFLIDTTPPILVRPPSDVVRACGNQNYVTPFLDWLDGVGNAMYEDYCAEDSLLDISYQWQGQSISREDIIEEFMQDAENGCEDDVIINGNSFDQVLASIQIAFFATDPCGNQLPIGAAWFALLDVSAPSILTPAADTVVSCSDTTAIRLAFSNWYHRQAGLVAADDCGTIIYESNYTFAEAWDNLKDSLALGCGNTGHINLSFTARDLCGNPATSPQFVGFTVQDSSPPSILSPVQNKNVECTASTKDSLLLWLDQYGFALLQEDCSEILVDSVRWISNDGQTGLIRVGAGPRPNLDDLACSFRISAQFYLRDECGNRIRLSGIYRVLDTSSPQFINWADTLLVSCQSEVSDTTGIVQDLCTVEPNVSFIDDTVRAAQDSLCSFYNYEIRRTYTATDGCGNQAQFTQLLLIRDQQGPSFTLPLDVRVQCNEADSLSITGFPSDTFDLCGSPISLIFQDSLVRRGCESTIFREWIATDICANENRQIQQIQIVDTIAPQLIRDPANFVYRCQGRQSPDSVLSHWLDTLYADFVDQCDSISQFIASPGTYLLSDPASWPGQRNVHLQADSCRYVLGDTIVVQAFDIVAYDACQNAIATQVQFILIDEERPSLSCPDSLSYPTLLDSCFAQVSLPPIEVEDGCSLRETSLSVAIRGIDTVNGTQLDSVQYILAKGVYQVEAIATDCSGNMDQCSFTLHVADTQAPDIICPPDTSLPLVGTNCRIQVELPTPLGVSDNCALPSPLSYTFAVGENDSISRQWTTNMPQPIVTLDGGQTQVTYQLADGSGTVGRCTFEVTVIDTSSPQAICQPTTIFANPSGVVFTIIDPMMLDGGSIDNCAIDSMAVRPQSVRCEQVGEQLDIVFYVFDEFGNVDSCETIIRVASEVVIPEAIYDLCDPDTLFLFANAPPPVNAYTYSWTGPNGFQSNLRNPVIPNVGAQNSGTYQLRIEGFNNCFAEGSVSVNISDITTPEIQADNPVQCEGNQVRLETNSFSGNVSYSWYKGVPPSGLLLGTTTQAFFDVSPQPGLHNYYVVVDAADCTSAPSLPVRIEIITQPIALVDTPIIEVCEGETILLPGIDQGPGYRYQWTGPNGYFSTNAQPEGIPNASSLMEGEYSLVVVTGDCESTPARVRVIVNALPPAPSVSFDSILCEGENLRLSITPPVRGDKFYWIAPDGTQYTTQQPTFDFGPSSGNESGLWTIFSSQNNCRSVDSAQVPITVEVLPDIEIEQEGIPCEGDSIRLSATSYPGARYTWSGPGFSDTGRSIVFVPNGGLYELTMTSRNGCVKMANKQIDIFRPAAITSISNSGVDCINPGTDVRLVATIFPEDTGQYSYEWSGPNGFQSNEPVGIVANASQEDNGFYILRVFRNGCPSAPDSTEVRVTQIPALPNISGQNMVCEGQNWSVMASDPGNGEQQFIWLTPKGDTTTTVPTLLRNTVSRSDSGVYRLQTIVNGCESELSDSFRLTVWPSPNQPLILGESFYCEGDSLLLYTNQQGYTSASWELPDGSIVQADTLRIFPLTLVQEGNYLLQTQLGQCSSPVSEPLFVEVQEIPGLPRIQSTSDQICVVDELAEIELCIDPQSATPGASYQWINADNGRLLDGPTGGLCATIGDLSSFSDGTNNVFVYASVNGCVSNTSIPATIQMTVPPPGLVAEAGLDQAICANVQAELRASAPTVGQGEWRVLTPPATVSDPSDPNAFVFDLTVGENIFEWVLSYDFCEEFSRDSAIILFDEQPEPVDDIVVTPFNTRLELDIVANDRIVGPVQISIVQPPIYGTIQRSGTRLTYFPQNGYIGRDSVLYQLCSVNCPALCATASIQIQVGDESLCDVPTIFTPNDDGINDFFTIQCLSSQSFQNNEVWIFNQYGDQVFHAQPYQNNWQGTYNGKPLPVGTYYFVIDFGDGRPTEKGFLVLER